MSAEIPLPATTPHTELQARIEAVIRYVANGNEEVLAAASRLAEEIGRLFPDVEDDWDWEYGKYYGSGTVTLAHRRRLLLQTYWLQDAVTEVPINRMRD
jgi:hypothetical protein